MRNIQIIATQPFFNFGKFPKLANACKKLI